MKYHYSRQEGWLGNPCGLVFYKDRYHLFFQHNPDSPRFGPLHWGHATSDDMISWEECPAAISPESELSCNSGSAIVHDGKIWIFYTSMSAEYKETVCAAYSEDGINFKRAEGNPVVTAPSDEGMKFRDPFVFRFGNEFRMITGAGLNGIAKVLQYSSDDLITWHYKGELLSDSRFGGVIEAPQLIEVDGKWIFVIQSEKQYPTKVLFAVGDYDGEGFVFANDREPFTSVESGKDFYNPVTCKDADGNAVLMAWLYSQKMNSSAISCPREISISRKGEVIMQPYGDLKRRQNKESNFVSYDDGRLRVFFDGRTLFEKAYRECPEIKVIEDIGMVEVFLDGGIETISMHIC